MKTSWSYVRFAELRAFHRLGNMKESLISLPYRKFLRSHYWTSLRTYVLERNHRKCARCNKIGTQLHHKSYRHHGEEHNHLQDLQMLCGECHLKAHENRHLLERAIGKSLTDELCSWSR